MTYEEIKGAVSEMESLFYQSKTIAKSALKLCRGQLRNFEVDEYTLKMLKRELQGFDAVKCQWKRRA